MGMAEKLLVDKYTGMIHTKGSLQNKKEQNFGHCPNLA
jgi:hypothetical protein